MYIKQSISILLTSAMFCAGLATAQTATTQTTQTERTTTTAAPVAGTATLGVVMAEMDVVIAGWSVQKDLLRKAVVNEKNEKIGAITDIVVSPNPDARLPAVSFAIIGVGGFLGMGKRDVAIPMEQLKLQDKKLVLAGATKEALKALPEFEYKRK